MINFDKLYFHGRFKIDNDLIYFYNTASGIEFNFTGKKIIIIMKANEGQKSKVWMKAIIDDDYDNSYDLVPSLEFSKFSIELKDNNHNVKILKASEAIESTVVVSDLMIDGKYLDKPVYDKTFLVIGDSTVAAYGNLGKLTDEKTLMDTDGLSSFAYLAARYFKASLNALTASGWGVVFSPWTTPNRISIVSYIDKMAPFSTDFYDLKKVNPNVIIISLGTNDYEYYILSQSKDEKDKLINELSLHYHKMLDMLNNYYKDVPIFMVYGVMGEEGNYEVMKKIYEENKDKYNLHLSFLLGDRSGVSYHPTKASHLEMSQTLINELKKVLS